jgi:hypothetical protein
MLLRRRKALGAPEWSLETPHSAQWPHADALYGSRSQRCRQEGLGGAGGLRSGMADQLLSFSWLPAMLQGPEQVSLFLGLGLRGLLGLDTARSTHPIAALDLSGLCRH